MLSKLALCQPTTYFYTLMDNVIYQNAKEVIRFPLFFTALWSTIMKGKTTSLNSLFPPLELAPYTKKDNTRL